MSSWSFVLIICGTITAAVFSFIETKWMRAVQAAVFGAVVSFIVAGFFEMNLRLIEFSKEMSQVKSDVREYAGTRYAADRFISTQISTPGLQEVFRSQLRKLDAQAQGLATGELQVGRDDVFDLWTNLVSHSIKEILATNMVSEDDWKNFSGGDNGTRTQELVLRANPRMSITRVMIYDSRLSGSKQGLERLACYQKSHLASFGDRYVVRELDLASVIQNPRYVGYVGNLGAYDVVVYDGAAALLTTVDERDGIKSSRLTVSSGVVDVARNFVNRALDDSTPIVCPD